MSDTMNKRDHIAAMMMVSISRELLEADTYVPNREPASKLCHQLMQQADDDDSDAVVYAASWAYAVADALIHASKVTNA